VVGFRARREFASVHCLLQLPAWRPAVPAKISNLWLAHSVAVMREPFVYMGISGIFQ
jgi:hypothetical protein